MQALVQDYVDKFASALDAKSSGEDGTPTSRLAAYIQLSAEEFEQVHASAAGVVAALAEDPDFLKPIRNYKRLLLDRLKAENPDTAKLIIAYLVIEGLRSMKLFDMDILHEDERNIALSYLLDETATSCGKKPS